MMCHNKGLPIFRPEDKPPTQRRAAELVARCAHEKAPQGSGAQVRSIVSRQRACRRGRSQRHGQDDTGSSIGGATDETPSRAIGFCVGRPTRKSPAEAGLSFNGLWRRARQPGCRAPIPRPENLGDTSRIPWREVGQIPETPPGVPTGFGFGSVGGGSLPKLASGQRGSGACCPTRV